MTQKHDNLVAKKLHTMGYDISKDRKSDTWQIYVLGSPFGSYKELYPLTDDDTQLMKTNFTEKRFVRDPNTLKVGKQPHYWAQFADSKNDPPEVRQHTLWYNRVMTDIFGSGNEKVMEVLNAHYNKLRSFVDLVDKPKSFNRRGEISINQHILPFFLGNYSPETTSYALRNNYHAGNIIVLYAQAAGKVDEKDLTMISGLPEEIIRELM